MRVVMKFGGTSVGSVRALQHVIEIVAKARQQNDHEVVVVVSAMSGVTDRLLNAAHRAEAGDEKVAHEARAEIEQKHAEASLQFLGDTPVRNELMSQVTALLDEFEALCHGIHVLGELTPRALDVIGGLGERMNAPQVAAILTNAGVSAQGVEATELIVTDDRFGSAVPLIDETAQKSQTRLQPLLAQAIVPVVTGYIGATPDGIPTTLPNH